jgi:hypothetical protein
MILAPVAGGLLVVRVRDERELFLMMPADGTDYAGCHIVRISSNFVSWILPSSSLSLASARRLPCRVLLGFWTHLVAVIARWFLCYPFLPLTGSSYANNTPCNVCVVWWDLIVQDERKVPVHLCRRCALLTHRTLQVGCMTSHVVSTPSNSGLAMYTHSWWLPPWPVCCFRQVRTWTSAHPVENFLIHSVCQWFIESLCGDVGRDTSSEIWLWRFPQRYSWLKTPFYEELPVVAV